MEAVTNVFGTAGRAVDYFAAPTFRPYQKETIEEIEQAYEQGYRHVLLDAPTGSGKSHIARALAFQAGEAHILTVQKLLQDQYMRDFPEMFVMKGRGAYTCINGGGYQTCATGPCKFNPKITPPDCPYRVALRIAKDSAVTVHNFDSFYYQNVFGSGYAGRKLLVVDEAHNIPGKFSDFLSFSIDSRGIDVPELDTLSEYDEFVQKTQAEYVDELSNLQAQYDAGLLNDSSVRRMEELRSLTYRMRRYLTERESDHPTEYVFDYSSTGGKYPPRVTFRPVFVGDYSARWLFGYGERSLLMSATILSKEIFCREVGLDPDRVKYIQIPSTFPAENRPIIKRYAGSMSYKNIRQTLPTIAEYVQEIVDRFPGRKGIVQTHSEKIARYLRDNLDDARFTYNKDFLTPQEMLDVHARKEGSIIIASGLREGLDLRGKLSQVQVFCKIPYPSLGDKVVKRKLELDPDWYGWITTVMFVQALGRSVRSDKEKAVTYVLDSGFGFFYKKNKRFIPPYIREAIKW